MGILQPEHLLLILLIVLIVFGAGKLPDTMRDLGRGVRTFRSEAEGKTTPPEPAAAPPPAPPVAPVAATKTCAACGSVQAASAKFCANCGKPL